MVQQTHERLVMSVPAYLKPENGRLGSAFGIWLDQAASGLATRFFLLWFVLLYTAFGVISSASVGLHPVLLETYARGLHPAAGYEGHAPLAALMAAGWFSLFPQTDWAFHLLAMVNAAIGLYATYRIARGYLDGDKRIAVLLFLLLTPFYQFIGQRFGANQILLSTWPIATYCFLRAFSATVGSRWEGAANSSPPSRGEGSEVGGARGGTALPRSSDPPPRPSPTRGEGVRAVRPQPNSVRTTRSLAWSAAAGAAAALAMLGNYYSIFLVVGFAAAALTHPARWTYLRSFSPWLSVVVGGAVLTPHVQWLFATGFPSFAFATTPLAQGLWKAAVCIVEAVAYVSVLLALYWVAVRPDRTTLRETLWPRDPDGRMLVILLATTLVLPVVAAPFIGAALTPLRTVSAWFLLPIVLLRPQAAELTRVAAIRITALVVAITIGALLAAPWLAWRKHVDGTKEGREYFRLVSAEITNAWHLATGLPLRIVMGNPYLASAVTFYSPDHPDSIPGFEIGAATPWITPDRLAKEGWAAICDADDENCVDAAKRQAAGKSNVQFINYSTINRYLGKPGKLGRFFFILAAPSSKPLILLQ